MRWRIVKMLSFLWFGMLWNSCMGQAKETIRSNDKKNQATDSLASVVANNLTGIDA